MKQLRAAWRLFHAVMHGFAGVWIIWRTFPRLTEAQRQQRVGEWSREMLRRIGVTLVVHGDAGAAGPLLLVANHSSWLDITVLHAARHCRFVSKADVKHWPLIGMLATGVGTLYIERASRRDAMRVVHHMAERLAAGDVLAIFPEGTTGEGAVLLPFHGNLLQSAIAAGVPVQPVAITFVETATGTPSFAASYTGQETLLQSIWRAFTSPDITARVYFGTPQPSRGRERRQWAHALREDVARMRGRAP